MARLLASVVLLVVLSVNLCHAIKLKAPAPCKGLECPRYTVINDGEGYEERQYEASMWVSTEIMSMNYESAVSEGFDKLFHYIDGHNDRKEKVEMTAPVATRVIPGQGPACESNFTIHFFVPFGVQSNPPQPSDPSVFFTNYPASRAYVKSFGGFASQNDWISAASELADALDASQTYDSSYYFTAGYDSPFTFFNRHNEVWFIAN
ncbi:heme-binding protein 2-like [Diadema antillarum]|uniref:heme-binding protein 2-like n=1 Tax=Diadema antillarum TaxID=105358 RepID=UPI003A86AB37